MDRNQVAVHFDTLSAVALRKESVDRNLRSYLTWIDGLRVALRKESVDRNSITRRCVIDRPVALRKESVDRNLQVCIITGRLLRRSPQGERG